MAGDVVNKAVSFHVQHHMFAWFITKIVLLFLYHRNKKPKFRCSAAILNTQGEVAMETELHWPEMKASEDLDFHCT